MYMTRQLFDELKEKKVLLPYHVSFPKIPRLPRPKMTNKRTPAANQRKVIPHKHILYLVYIYTQNLLNYHPKTNIAAKKANERTDGQDGMPPSYKPIKDSSTRLSHHQKDTTMLHYGVCTIHTRTAAALRSMYHTHTRTHPQKKKNYYPQKKKKLLLYDIMAIATRASEHVQK